jgi:hypothetical protein
MADTLQLALHEPEGAAHCYTFGSPLMKHVDCSLPQTFRSWRTEKLSLHCPYLGVKTSFLSSLFSVQ